MDDVAKLVIKGDLSVGQLIAFNMLSGQVMSPVMRLAQLWTDFQQTGISIQRLGDILNTRTEIANSKTALPPIRGRRDDRIDLAEIDDAGAFLLGDLRKDRDGRGKDKESGKSTHETLTSSGHRSAPRLPCPFADLTPPLSRGDTEGSFPAAISPTW